MEVVNLFVFKMTATSVSEKQTLYLIERKKNRK